VQIPERTGKEITEIAPQVQDIWGIGDAFRRSIIWRSPESFSEVTLQTLNRLARTDYDWNETHDVILTVATLPEHPFNAAFLNQRLRRDTMPERDAWWSIFLHNAWRSHGAVDRLVDWASSVGHEDALEDETVDLCATALAWMLTSSNRQLRDRVTKALVALMTGRLGAVIRMVKRFADVDDLYVTERIYAVAYGTAMRSYNAKEVGALATCVYDKVFATGMPPAHILLRDYARGVVERAIHLESDISIVTDHIRPPYNSTWPSIPTEEEIKPFLPDWSRGSHDSGDLEWARNRIGSSVMHDDFARYVIGTNSGPYSSHWLSLPLVQPRWKSPGELLDELVSGFSQDEKNAWGEFTAAEATFNQKQIERLLLSIRKGSVVKEPQDERNVDEEQIENNGHHRDIDAAKEELNAAFGRLEAVITEGHARLLKDILAEKRDADARRGPRFDLRLIQRYILWRVFDLGWTTERFGQFDRFAIGYHGREPSKAERFGKKYQWIAYHEILALVADNFQYRREYGEDGGGQGYEGPWQESLRDIDPSCLLRAPGKKSEGDFGSWWPPFEYARWDEPQDHLEWVKHYDDIPSFEDLLRTFCPRNNSWWITLQSHFNWNQPTPADRESTEVERREIWLMCTGYLVRADDGPTFMAWAEGADFWGRWMPEPPENYRIFFGEYGWSPASRYFDQEYFGGRRWEQPGYDCPVEVQTGVQEYLAGSSSFDFSVDEGYRLRLPCEALVTGLGIEWSGSASDFVDRSGNVIAFDPTAYEDGPGVLLLRQDYLQDFLEREQLTICWAVIGEKRVIGGGFEPQYYSALRINGAYQLTTGKPNGFLKCLLESRTVRKGEISQDLLATIRTQQGI
jgi:hypothetical protein